MKYPMQAFFPRFEIYTLTDPLQYTVIIAAIIACARSAYLQYIKSLPLSSTCILLTQYKQ